MKFRRGILITGTRLEIAVTLCKHSLGGQSNRQKVGGGILRARLASWGLLQKMEEDGVSRLPQSGLFLALARLPLFLASCLLVSLPPSFRTGIKNRCK
jgi:hypothetical protein